MKRLTVMLAGILLLLVSVSAFFNAQPTRGVEYQGRGNRYEGVKPKPVSGYNIELISALVAYKEDAPRLPDQFKLKFYLEHPANTYVTVRELDYKYYYWMDKVQPAEPWRQGFDNTFAWPTQPVIQQLQGLKMYDLGVLVRLDKSEPGAVERVAPAIFYHSQYPTVITGYLFTFKTFRDARIQFSVYKHGTKSPVFKVSFPKQFGGTPFTVKWPAANAADGVYELVADGRFKDNDEPFQQTVGLYHRHLVK